MINALGSFVQNTMMTPSLSPESDSGKSGSGSGSVHYGNPSGPGFYHRNVWKPLTLSFVGGQTKELFLDIGERTDIPQVPKSNVYRAVRQRIVRFRYRTGTACPWPTPASWTPSGASPSSCGTRTSPS